MAPPTGYGAKAGSAACRCRASGWGLDSCGTLCCSASPYTDPDPAGQYYWAKNNAGSTWENVRCYEQTPAPTPHPTPHPTNAPTPNPTNSPTPNPTNSPTLNPTNSPTPDPTNSPTNSPTPNPTNSPTPNPTYSPTDSPTSSPTLEQGAGSCLVWVYEHWPEGITAGTAGLEAAEQAWGGRFPMGAHMLLRGTGYHPLGALNNLTSSVKVEGACCAAYGYTSTDCSGKEGNPIKSTTQLLSGNPIKSTMQL